MVTFFSFEITKHPFIKFPPTNIASLSPWEAGERHTADTPQTWAPLPYCKAVSHIWSRNGARTDTSKDEESEEPICTLNWRVALIQDTELN